MGAENGLMIQVENISMTYAVKKGREPLVVLDNINFTVKEKEFICILGPSGCGKTTLLSILGGFIKATGGRVMIDGSQVKGPSPKYLSIFQDYKLLPWRTVRKNIELGFETIKPKLSQKEINEKVDAQIESVGLTGFEDYHPTEISGGMKQRVALARALVLEPKILFMDEPFAALDALTRDEIRHKFRTLMVQMSQTVIMITHNINEAIYFADRIIIMRAQPGRIVSILDVRLPNERDAYTSDFLQLRDEVFTHLNS